MAIIHVDGQQYEVDPADNLLQACLSRGLDLPYFCWHPALGSVGACRQCAVKIYRDENDKVGRLVMACMTPATDNTRLSIGDAESKEFREGIISLMMTNHPHDCPVCEEGGHCHLQDMTVMTGHYRRQYHFTKRTHRNQDLGPFIAHEMNRCIACYRCVRFYNDYAGGTDFGVFGSAANVYFGRIQPGTLQNYFSGNLTEVCPTGVFTDKTHSERYARKWDMQFAPSICAGCSVGCNISPGERYGEVRRIENRYHGELNGYFLCDRGRFGYGYVNRKDRPRKPLAKHADGFATIDNADAITRIRQLLTSGKPVVGIGSPRASVEANFELRALVGAAAFSNGMTRHETELCETVLGVLRDGPVQAATIRAIDEADAVLVLGEDVLGTAPRVALALRQAARGKWFDMTREKKVPDWQAESAADIGQHEFNPLFIATPAPTGFDDVAKATFRLAPDAIAQLGFAVAHVLDATAPAATFAQTDAVESIVNALRGAKRPLIVSGTGAGSVDVIRAAANVAYALHKTNPAVRISLAVPEANSLAMALFDARPLEDALAPIEHADTVVVVLENDLERRLQKPDVDRLLTRAKLVVLDHQMTPTARRAEVVLPAASFAEATGTLVNMEGRAQRYFQNFDPAYYDRSIATLESWRWLCRIRGGDAEHENLDDVLAEIEAALPQFKGVVDAAPGSKFRMHGMGLARAPHRQSGRTAARAVVFVHEPRSTVDDDTALNFSMEGYSGAGREDRPPELLPFAWAPGWNSPQAWNKFQTEVGGALRGGDPGVHLFEPTGRASYSTPTTPHRGDDLRAIALHEHFGSEELSNLAGPIPARTPPAYVVLNSDEARRLGVGDAARVAIDGIDMHLAVRVRDDFPRDGVGLPVGLPGVVPFDSASLCTVAPLRANKGG